MEVETKAKSNFSFRICVSTQDIGNLPLNNVFKYWRKCEEGKVIKVQSGKDVIV